MAHDREASIPTPSKRWLRLALAILVAPCLLALTMAGGSGVQADATSAQPWETTVAGG